MEEHRIQINGIWYVREEQPEKEDLELNHYLGAVWEDDYACFDFSILSDEQSSNLGYFSVKYTDKTVNPFKDHYWDNEVWFNGLLEGNPESLKELGDLKVSSRFAFITLLTKLKKLKWF